MFGGLGICSLEAVVAKDDKEYIIEANDCATTLLGESQEDDRKNIAEGEIWGFHEKTYEKSFKKMMQLALGLFRSLWSYDQIDHIPMTHSGTVPLHHSINTLLSGQT